MDTPTFTPTDIVSFAGQKDAVNLKAAFDQMIGQKVMDAIQARKQDVASTMFNPAAEEDEVSASSEQQDGEEQNVDMAANDQPEEAGQEQIAQETEDSNEDTEVTS